MLSVAQHTLKEVDVILWLVEPTTFVGENEKYIVEQLKKVKTPVILIVNKMDTVEQKELDKVIAVYKQLLDYEKIIPVSALRSRNLDTVIDTIMNKLPEGPQYYDEDTITDQPMRQIVAELIREKALRLLEQEIPHGIAVTIEQMKRRENGLYDIDASIICEKASHKGIIIGKNGSMLKKIGSTARRDVEQMLEARVNLQIWVKVRKEWRDSDIFLKNFGYNKSDI